MYSSHKLPLIFYTLGVDISLRSHNHLLHGSIQRQQECLVLRAACKLELGIYFASLLQVATQSNLIDTTV